MITETLLYSREIDHSFPIAPQVYSYLRARIVDNRLPPGAKISEASLADTLNISRTPLRAALQKLATEGLVNTRILGLFSLHSVESLFPNSEPSHCYCFFWLEWAGYLAVAGLNLLDKPW